MTRRLLVLLVLAIATPAIAEDAKTLNKQGLDAAKAKDWELARQKFEQSYALAEEPLTLYNLAAAQEHTDRLVAARANYTKYLAQSRPGPDHDRFRKAAKAKLPVLDKAVPTLKIKAVGFPSTVIVELDQRALLGNELATPIPVDPGSHVIVARRDAEILARKELTIARGAREEVELVAPPPKVDRPPPTPVVVRPAPPVEKPPGGVLRSTWFWGASAVVLIGGAAAYYFLYYSKADPTPGTLGRGVIDL
jgi:hypothetical protein